MISNACELDKPLMEAADEPLMEAADEAGSATSSHQSDFTESDQLSQFSQSTELTEPATGPEREEEALRAPTRVQSAAHFVESSCYEEPEELGAEIEKLNEQIEQLRRVVARSDELHDRPSGWHDWSCCGWCYRIWGGPRERPKKPAADPEQEDQPIDQGWDYAEMQEQPGRLPTIPEDSAAPPKRQLAAKEAELERARVRLRQIFENKKHRRRSLVDRKSRQVATASRTWFGPGGVCHAEVQSGQPRAEKKQTGKGPETEPIREEIAQPAHKQEQSRRVSEESEEEEPVTESNGSADSGGPDASSESDYTADTMPATDSERSKPSTEEPLFGNQSEGDAPVQTPKVEEQAPTKAAKKAAKNKAKKASKAAGRKKFAQSG